MSYTVIPLQINLKDAVDNKTIEYENDKLQIKQDVFDDIVVADTEGL